MNRLLSPDRKEFICNLIPKDTTRILKETKYVSKYRPAIKNRKNLISDDIHMQHKTMGKAREEPPNPKEYLKKFAHTFRKLKKSNNKFSYNCNFKKEKVPTKNEWVALPPICESQNVVNRNAICAIMQPVYKPEKVIADTKKGDTFKLESTKTHSGLEKKFVFKDGYGRIPKYVRKRIKAVNNTRDAYEHYLNEKLVNRSNYFLTPDQRSDLIDGLKKAWDNFNKDYLKLSHSNDTLKFKKYKKYLESEMTELEKDIQLVENHKFIFIEPN